MLKKTFCLSDYSGELAAYMGISLFKWCLGPTNTLIGNICVKLYSLWPGPPRASAQAGYKTRFTVIDVTNSSSHFKIPSWCGIDYLVAVKLINHLLQSTLDLNFMKTILITDQQIAAIHLMYRAERCKKFDN